MEMQNNTTVKYHYTHTLVWEESKSQKIRSVAKDAQKLKPFSCFGAPEQIGTYGNRLAVFQVINIEILHDPAIPFLDIYLIEMET